MHPPFKKFTLYPEQTNSITSANTNAMQITKTYKHIIDDYRFTYSDGAGLLMIERLVPKYIFGFRSSSWKWKQIYHGHDTPIREAILFFDNAKTQTP